MDASARRPWILRLTSSPGWLRNIGRLTLPRCAPSVPALFATPPTKPNSCAGHPIPSQRTLKSSPVWGRRASFMGVQARWPFPKGRLLVVDVGGGSAEVIVGENGHLAEA